jgi:hypothetical protein
LAILSKTPIPVRRAVTKISVTDVSVPAAVPYRITGPATLKIFVPTPRIKPSPFVSTAQEETALAKPVIGTSVPAPANLAILSKTPIPVRRAVTKISVTDVGGESAGIGDKVAGKGFLDSFVGLDSAEGVATISGATISSEGFIAGVADAFTAFGAVAEFEETDEQKIARLVYEVLPGMNSKIGYASVSLPAGAPASVKSALRAKNSSGYAVVVGEGADAVIIGLSSYLNLRTAVNLDGEAVTPSAEQIADAVAAVSADDERYQSNYKTVAGRLAADGAVLTRLDTFASAPVSLFNAYSVEGDAAVSFVFLMQSSSADGAIVYAVSVSASGSVVEILPISPAGASADGFDLTADVATAFAAYQQ